MYFLVVFDDGVEYICDKKKISNRIGDNNCTVKYVNGSRYPARILAIDEKRENLEQLKKNASFGTKNLVEDDEEDDVILVPEVESTADNSVDPVITSTEGDSIPFENDEFSRSLAQQVPEKENIEHEQLKKNESSSNTKKMVNDGKNDGNLSNREIQNEEEISFDPVVTSDEENSISLENELPESSTQEDCEEENIEHEQLKKNESSSNTKKMVNDGKNDGNLSNREIQNEEEISFDPVVTSDEENSISLENELPESSTQEDCEGDNFLDIPTFSEDESGSEYELPKSESSDSSSDSLEKNETSNNSSRQNEVANVDNGRHSLNSSLSANQLGTSSKDDADMFVQPSRATANSKKLFCMFCGRFQSKFARHLETVHKNEEEVKKFIFLPKSCPERKEIIDKIRKKAQFFFNTNQTVNDGELIVCRRPGTNLKRTAKDYVACQNCKGFFTKNNIRHHAKKCFSYNGAKNRTLFAMGRKVVGRIHPDASDTLRKNVFPVMREDEVIRAIRYDHLIILYGNKMCSKYRLQHQHDMIRANLRLLGRFMISLKGINQSINEFADLFDPIHFDEAISSINVVAGLNANDQTYRAPSTAYSLGSLLKKCGNILISYCIKTKQAEKKQNAEDFLKLLVEDIGVSVNKTVEETQTRNSRRKVVEMPTKRDISSFKSFLKKKRQVAMSKIEEKFSKQTWLELAEATLSSVQLFNRRRAGEIERIYIEDFESFKMIDKDMFKTLDQDTQKLAKNYVRFVIRGKLNRTVPVLLSQELVACIQTIIKYREAMGVHRENRYVFGIPGFEKNRHKYLRACALMRKFSLESGAAFPNSLRGTKLRKHIATNCINLDLSETEVSDVANFMGHSEKIHKEHYRQPILSREILRMSRILELAQGGKDSESDEESNNGEKGIGQTGLVHSPEPATTFEDQPSTSSYQPQDTFELPVSTGKKKRSTSPYGPVKRKPRWSEEEKRVANLLFGDAIRTGIYPSLKKIQEKKQAYPCLENRNPAVIKTWISNQIKVKNPKCT